MSEKGFFERVGDFTKKVGQGIRDEWNEEGVHNYAFAIPGALLGFMFTQNMVGSWFGGGFLSQVAAFPLAITAAMAGAVFMTRAVNNTYEWAKENFGEEKARSNSQSAQVEQERAQQRTTGQTPQQSAAQAVSTLTPETSARPTMRPHVEFEAAEALKCLQEGKLLAYDVKGASTVEADLLFTDATGSLKLGACLDVDTIDDLSVNGATFNVITDKSSLGL